MRRRLDSVARAQRPLARRAHHGLWRPQRLLQAVCARQAPLALQQRRYQALLLQVRARVGGRARVLLQQRRRARAHRCLHLLQHRAAAEEVLAGQRRAQRAHADAARASHGLSV